MYGKVSLRKTYSKIIPNYLENWKVYKDIATSRRGFFTHKNLSNPSMHEKDTFN